jgi:antirestriction protein ArdC
MGIDRNAMYGQVAESLIGLMESGEAPWTKPWIVRGRNDPFAPRNGYYDSAYNGFNSLYLSCVMADRGWSDPRFFTYKNAESLGGQVREGEKSTLVVYNKRVSKKDEESDKVKSFYLMKYYRVFNAAQIDGVEEYVPVVVEEVVPDDPFGVAAGVGADWFEYTGVVLGHGGDRAFYSPSGDLIQMPEKSQFMGMFNYYHTLFHEVIHSTGHESRQNRFKVESFGSERYAKEELVAEFGAAMVCVNAGVPIEREESADYIRQWAKRCKDDPGLLVTAVNAAQRAADMVLNVASVEEFDAVSN